MAICTAEKFGSLRFADNDEARLIADGILENTDMLRFLKFFDLSVDNRLYVEKLGRIKTVDDFHKQIMVPIFEEIFEKTTDGITAENIDILPNNDSVLFISNHRDIVLDSGAMNLKLHQNGYGFGNPGIGDNLLMNEMIQSIFKMMKCFVIRRDLAGKEQVRFLKKLSGFIKHTITDYGESIWIAQSSGRAKDGNDKTNPALLKMLTMAGQENAVEYLKSLHIHAVSCSFEWDPCDVFKVKELMAKHNGEQYVKDENEDLFSIRAGICGYKGRVHVVFNKVHDEELHKMHEFRSKDRFLYLATLLDKKIMSGYRLWPSNYVAADLTCNTDIYADFYTAEERQMFIQRMVDGLGNKEKSGQAHNIFSSIYANPVFNNEAL